jgi:predicted RNA-binding protein with EMAP domain
MNIKDWLLKEEKADVFLISDISKHGCSGGFGGLIYYKETVRFHDEHEQEIWDLLYQYAQDEGLKLIDKLAQVSKDAGSLTQLKNQLVWWAVEVRAHEICNEREAA